MKFRLFYSSNLCCFERRQVESLILFVLLQWPNSPNCQKRKKFEREFALLKKISNVLY